MSWNSFADSKPERGKPVLVRLKDNSHRIVVLKRPADCHKKYAPDYYVWVELDSSLGVRLDGSTWDACPEHFWMYIKSE